MLAISQALSLAARGHEVSLTCFGWDPSRWGAMATGLEVHSLPRRNLTDLLRGFGSGGKWGARAHRAARSLGRAEIVVAHGSPSQAMLGNLELPGRKFWYCHEPTWRLHPERCDYQIFDQASLAQAPREQAEAIRSEGVKVLHRAAAQRAFACWDLEGVGRLDGLMSNSPWGASQLGRIYGDEMPPRVVPPMVRFGQFRPRPGKGILAMARLELLKNVETVIRGFAAFRQRRGEGHLHIVGEGSRRTALESLMLELGVQGHVRFHGSLEPGRDDAALERIYDDCGIFALLPLDESFGLVFPEAASRGLLLVGPDRGGPRDILEDERMGGIGQRVPTFSSDALAEAFLFLDRLPESEAASLRARADESCRTRYGWSEAGAKLEEAIAR